MRIAVSAKGGNDLYPTRTLKNATLVRATGEKELFKLFVNNQADAYANLKPGLLDRATQFPGSRIVEGSYTVIGYAAGVPKGRDAGARFVSEFIEYAKASGLVAKWIEQSGNRGLAVAPKAPGY